MTLSQWFALQIQVPRDHSIRSHSAVFYIIDVCIYVHKCSIIHSFCHHIIVTTVYVYIYGIFWQHTIWPICKTCYIVTSMFQDFIQSLPMEQFWYFIHTLIQQHSLSSWFLFQQIITYVRAEALWRTFFLTMIMIFPTIYTFKPIVTQNTYDEKCSDTDVQRMITVLYVAPSHIQVMHIRPTTN